MKPVLILATLGMSAFSASAFAQASLPAGIYEISGAVTSVTGGACPLVANRPVTGQIYYPGVGRDTTQILLESVVPAKSIYVAFLYAFSAVPAGGLNGWSVSPDYQLTKNGAGISDGESAQLTLTLTSHESYLAFAQGTFTIKTDDVGGPCSETVQAVFTRVAPFKEVQG